MGKVSLLLILAFVTLVLPRQASAEKLNLMRRWVVFPFDADTPALKNAAENAWWKCRERLTSGKKYLVASRQFLIQKDVFQPRRELAPEDVKLLGHLLDADVIVTGYSENREFQLNIYLSQNGQLFWTKKLGFHPSLKATDQLELIADKLLQEFVSLVPYQGFVITDPLVGHTIFEEDSKHFSVVDLGTTDDLQEGTDLQWIEVLLPDQPKPGAPLFEDLKVQVIAEGKVSKVKKGVVVAEIDRAKAVESITEQTLVYVPKLSAKLGEAYLAKDISKEKNSPEVLPTIINPVAPESQGAKKQTLVFGSVISVIGLLLLGL